MDQVLINALRQAIEDFIGDHREHPFRTLREIGVQADLKRRVDALLKEHSHVKAKIVDEPPGRTDPELNRSTDRVRLEAKIYLAAADAEHPQDTRHDRTDLLLYRTSDVRLIRHRSGPGDIVYKTLPESVLAAVEIKASPSHQLGQKRLYAKDIQRLLRLRSHPMNGGIAGFFLLLDKSSGLYGEPSFGPMNAIKWNISPAQPVSMHSILAAAHPRAILDDDLQHIFVTSTPPVDYQYIEIWNAAAEDERQIRRYAYREEQYRDLQTN